MAVLPPDMLHLAARLLAFDVAVLPLLIGNLRTGEANNRDNLILAAGGIAMIGIERALGWSDQSLWAVAAWVVCGVIGLLWLAAVASVPGGIAKTMMALLFWLPPMTFLLVFTVAFFLTAMIGYASRSREAPIVPAIVVACTGIWSFQNLALGFFSCGSLFLFGWLASLRARPIAMARMARVRERVVETSYEPAAAPAHGIEPAAAAVKESPMMAAAGALPDEIDLTRAADVAWVKARRDPALWHQAMTAIFAYIGDRHDFLPWLIRQPEMDRATAGWMFLWEGSRYLRGDASSGFDLDRISGEDVVRLFGALCERSERIGFSEDRLGLDPSFEAERQACLAVIANAQVAHGIIVPHAIIGRPFAAPLGSADYEVHDGLLVSTHFLRSALPHIYGA